VLFHVYIIFAAQIAAQNEKPKLLKAVGHALSKESMVQKCLDTETVQPLERQSKL